MSYDTDGLKKTLYPYLDQALASYKTFLAKENWSDAKEFSAYHSACKAVLGHIALLIKLTTEDKTTVLPDPCSDWIQRAKTAEDLQEVLNVDFD